MCLSWGVLALCMSSTLCGMEVGNGQEINVNYADSYYNEISEDDPSEGVTPSPPPCLSRDLSRWDKLFIMLEDSHMRQNMLLQHLDDLVQVQLHSLRDELGRVAADSGRACAQALGSACGGLAEQMRAGLQRAQQQMTEAEEKNQAQHNTTQHILEGIQRSHSACLVKLGGGLGHGTSQSQLPLKTVSMHPKEQDAIAADGSKLERALLAIASDLQKFQSQLAVLHRLSASRYIPQGCEMALFFPMRSKHAIATVKPDLPMSLRSFTLCLWAKATETLNKTVIFSYGTRAKPAELQLLLSLESVWFCIGNRSRLVGVQSKAEARQWRHYCGTWSSSQGKASLWIDGQQTTQSLGVAPGHVLAENGTVCLGQEQGSAGPEGGANPQLAYTGKMTGVNIWDYALSADRISQMSRPEGSCDHRGNVIGWGVSEVTTYGSVQYIN